MMNKILKFLLLLVMATLHAQTFHFDKKCTILSKNGEKGNSKNNYAKTVFYNTKENSFLGYLTNYDKEQLFRIESFRDSLNIINTLEKPNEFKSLRYDRAYKLDLQPYHEIKTVTSKKLGDHKFHVIITFKKSKYIRKIELLGEVEQSKDEIVRVSFFDLDNLVHEAFYNELERLLGTKKIRLKGLKLNNFRGTVIYYTFQNCQQINLSVIY